MNMQTSSSNTAKGPGTHRSNLIKNGNHDPDGAAEEGFQVLCQFSTPSCPGLYEGTEVWVACGQGEQKFYAPRQG